MAGREFLAKGREERRARGDWSLANSAIHQQQPDGALDAPLAHRGRAGSTGNPAWRRAWERAAQRMGEIVSMRVQEEPSAARWPSGSAQVEQLREHAGAELALIVPVRGEQRRRAAREHRAQDGDRERLEGRPVSPRRPGGAGLRSW
jgi:hypothetical protein